MSDYYVTLQVTPEAHADVIRAAYRALARLFHPDMPHGSEWQMNRINEAWSVLGDPARRDMYDRKRRAHAVTEVPRGSLDRQPSIVIDFGQYAGWSVRDLSRHDPEYLRWLIRTPSGRRFAREVQAVLEDQRSA